MLRACTGKFVIVVAFLVLLPAMAYAQASIAGVIKDTSGAILPGVTVEASSPALIEKTRSAVTDGTGQYKIVDLRPGTYAVTFSLAGFSTVRREGIELSGTFVASVNVEMKIGALDETITVSGASPVVDVQSSRQQAIITKDVFDAIPSGRLHNQVVALIPGVLVAGQDVGGSAGVQTPGAGQIHGGTTQDGRLLSDGINVGFNGGSSNGHMSNAAGAQEIVVTTSGGLGEAETGGIITNIIPRDGSNVFTASMFGSFANNSMQGDNYTDDLKNQGLKVPNSIEKVYDINPMGGGRIIRDRLWFYVTGRLVGANNYVAGMFVNKNAGNVNAWVPDFDTSRQAVTDNRYVSKTIRLTYQATAKNKFAVYYDTQDRCVTCWGGGSATSTIETSIYRHEVPNNVGSVTWQSPMTSRVLVEGGYGYYLQSWGGRPRLRDGTFRPGMINATEQGGAIPGLSFRSPTGYSFNWTGLHNWRASISYVTGAHNAKFGYYGAHDEPTNNTYSYTGYSNFRFNNGVANQFTQVLRVNQATLMKVTSFYAQDSWTRGPITLQGGVRFDHGITEFTGGHWADLPTILAGPWLATDVTFSGDDLKGTNYKDITPRSALSYDVFGNGKTAFKVTLGKYMSAMNGTTPLNPISRAATSASRAWTDSNRNFTPDCDFTTAGASNLTARGGDVCGPLSNPAFGTGALNATIDRAAFNGWGVRPYEWDFSTSVQHEILSGISVNVGYFRRWFGNFTVSDNLAVGPEDFDQFSITAPVDPRLPGGGGYTLSGLYNVKPAKFGATQNYITKASNYGKQYQRWNGVDVSVNGRLKDLVFQGGTSTGRDFTDNCEIQTKLPEINPTNPYCRVQANFQTQAKGFVSYAIPRVDVSVAATFQSLPNFVAGRDGVALPGLAANMNVQASQTDLGRLFAGGNVNSSVPVNLVAPGTLYGDRINQIDLRVAKILRFGRTRTQVGVDLYNLTNSNPVQSYNQTYVAGGSWLIPTSVLPARFVKVSAQVDF